MFLGIALGDGQDGTGGAQGDSGQLEWCVSRYSIRRQGRMEQEERKVIVVS